MLSICLGSIQKSPIPSIGGRPDKSFEHPFSWANGGCNYTAWFLLSCFQCLRCSRSDFRGKKNGRRCLEVFVECLWLKGRKDFQVVLMECFGLSDVDIQTHCLVFFSAYWPGPGDVILSERTTLCGQDGSTTDVGVAQVFDQRRSRLERLLSIRYICTLAETFPIGIQSAAVSDTENNVGAATHPWFATVFTL